VREAGRAPRLRRLVQRRSQQCHLRKVIEVPRLQRRVLTVVGEGQELARLLLERPIALQLDQ
jgi:hypothetical protein